MPTYGAPSSGEAISLISAPVEGVADCVVFPKEHARSTRAIAAACAAAAGVSGAYLAAQIMPERDFAWALVIALAFIGGLLSTWSPCGYSSLCLLRPVGRYSVRSLIRWTPTLSCARAWIYVWGRSARRCAQFDGIPFGLLRRIDGCLRGPRSSWPPLWRAPAWIPARPLPAAQGPGAA